MEARKVAERYYDALRRDDLDGVVATLEPGCQAEVPGRRSTGARRCAGGWGVSSMRFPDIEHRTGDLDVAGQTISAEVHVTGTHTEPMVTPPRGRFPQPASASRSRRGT
jgi:SnoaL-like domain